MDEPKVKSLYKALKLLDSFDSENPERGITEIAEIYSLQKSTVHNIFSTFEMCGFLKKNMQTNKYRIGNKVLKLSNSFYSSNSIRDIARPFLEKLNEDFGETVYFAILAEGQVLYVDHVFSGNAPAARSAIGVVAPVYCTGLGKAILSALPVDEINKLLDKVELSSFTPDTIITKQELFGDLEITKDRGYAIDNMEHEYGVKCVAVPIRNIQKEVVGAISISGPSLRFEDGDIKKYGATLIEVSRKMQELIRL